MDEPDLLAHAATLNRKDHDVPLTAGSELNDAARPYPDLTEQDYERGTLPGEIARLEQSTGLQLGEALDRLEDRLKPVLRDDDPVGSEKVGPMASTIHTVRLQGISIRVDAMVQRLHGIIDRLDV
jgi:hypothetical protein